MYTYGDYRKTLNMGKLYKQMDLSLTIAIWTHFATSHQEARTYAAGR